MKKQILLLAGTAVILASCGSNSNNQGQTQAQVDSAVNAKLAEHDAANAAKNDSTLKAIEAEKAAATAKENEHHAAPAHHSGGKKEEVATPVAPPAAPAPPPATIGNGKPKMGTQTNDANTNTGNTIGNGKPKMGGH